MLEQLAELEVKTSHVSRLRKVDHLTFESLGTYAELRIVVNSRWLEARVGVHLSS